jgi:hypothetical protein
MLGRWRWQSAKGVITRHPADFYPERAAWAYGVFFNPGVTDECFIELYNNAIVGHFIRVYSVTSGWFVDAPSYLSLQKGPVGNNTVPAGGAFGYVTPVITNSPAIPGQILWGHSPPNPSHQPTFQPLLGAGGLPGADSQSGAPIAVLGPGYSLLAYGYQQNGSNCEASFYYMWD